jgi:single-stranded-DNA-specific exonuclease
MPLVLARIYAARGIHATSQLEYGLGGLPPFDTLKNAPDMARRLADAIAEGKRLLVVADYDSDGATACALAVRALREFGATIDYLVPNRFEYGYGLTPEIAVLAAQRKPDILITVDNGIASVAGIETARQLGMETLVTDHHLPGDELPAASSIVNPNQPGCAFPGKHLAGVGVIFYVVLALRAELRRRGAFAGKAEPHLAKFLDLVALGTIADVVKLEDYNRILVHQGLKRIRAGQACPGIGALLLVARRDARCTTPADLGFAAAPRLNAAGRLDDMALGIECLLCDDETSALLMAQQLDDLNRERRDIEAQMKAHAELKILDSLCDDGVTENRYSLCLHDPGWHPGVIGILAARLRERFHRPTIVFAPGNDGELKGSGRSIRNLHLRDTLDLLSKQHPGLLQSFGGHAAACGLTIASARFNEFSKAFESVVQSLLTPADLESISETDGELAPQETTLELAQRLREEIWGQGFPGPLFNGCFTVKNQRVVGGKHLRLRLLQQTTRHDAILFSHDTPLPKTIQAIYRLDVNEYKGAQNLQLVIEYWEPA